MAEDETLGGLNIKLEGEGKDFISTLDLTLDRLDKLSRTSAQTGIHFADMNKRMAEMARSAASSSDMAAAAASKTEANIAAAKSRYLTRQNNLLDSAGLRARMMLAAAEPDEAMSGGDGEEGHGTGGKKGGGGHGGHGGQIMGQLQPLMPLFRGHEMQIYNAVGLMKGYGATIGGIAAVGGPVFAMGLAFKGVLDRQFELRESTIKWNAELKETSVKWSEIARAQQPITGAGQQHAEGAAEAAKNAREKLLTHEKEMRERGRYGGANLHGTMDALGVGVEMLMQGEFGKSGFDKTTYGRQSKLEVEQYQQDKARADRLEKSAQRERGIQLTRNATERDLAVEASKVSAMYEGPAKRRLSLDNDIAKQREDLLNKNKDKLTTMDAAHVESMAGLQGGKERGDEEARFQKERAAVVKDNQASMDAFAATTANKWKGERRKEQEELLAQTREAEQASIASTKTGLQSRLALMDHAAKTEIDLATKAGQSKAQLDQIEAKNSAKRAEVVRDNAHEISNSMLDLDEAMQKAGHTKSNMDIEWTKKLRDLQWASTHTKEELEALRLKMMALNDTQVKAGIADSMKLMDISMERALRHTTELEEAKASAREQARQRGETPAQQELHDAEAIQKKKLEYVNEVRERMMAIYPKLRLEEDSKHIQEMRNLDVIDDKQQAFMLRMKSFELFGKGFNAGSFNSSWRQSAVNVSAMDTRHQWKNLTGSTAEAKMNDPGTAGAISPTARAGASADATGGIERERRGAAPTAPGEGWRWREARAAPAALPSTEAAPAKSHGAYLDAMLSKQAAYKEAHTYKPSEGGHDTAYMASHRNKSAYTGWQAEKATGNDSGLLSAMNAIRDELRAQHNTMRDDDRGVPK